MFFIILIGLIVVDIPVYAALIYVSGVDFGGWSIVIVLSTVAVPVTIVLVWEELDTRKASSCNEYGHGRYGHKKTCSEYRRPEPMD